MRQSPHWVSLVTAWDQSAPPEISPLAEERRVRKTSLNSGRLVWCREQDSNLHALRHWILSPARLPIPPSRRSTYFIAWAG